MAVRMQCAIAELEPLPYDLKVNVAAGIRESGKPDPYFVSESRLCVTSRSAR